MRNQLCTTVTVDTPMLTGPRSWPARTGKIDFHRLLPSTSKRGLGARVYVRRDSLLVLRGEKLFQAGKFVVFVWVLAVPANIGVSALL